MSAFNSPLGSNNAALQDDVPTGNQSEVQGAPPSPLNMTSHVQYPSLQDTDSTTPSNNTAPPEPTHILVSNQSTSASNTQPMRSDPPNPSVVTDADLRTFKCLQSKPLSIPQGRPIVLTTSHRSSPHYPPPQNRRKTRCRPPLPPPRIYSSAQSLLCRHHGPTSGSRCHLERTCSRHNARTCFAAPRCSGGGSYHESYGTM
jgi:hypothetical protein